MAQSKKRPVIDDRQLQLDLWKDFDDHVAVIAATVQKMRLTAQRLVESGASPQKVQRAVVKAAKKVEGNAPELRKRINHVVRVHIFGKHLEAREIWRIVYARLREVTGIDVIARAIAKGKKRYLDIVEDLGLLQKTLDIAAAL